MLARREDEDWSLTAHRDRDYKTEAEKSFFEAIENPKPATPELKELYRVYGKYVRNDR
jgi:hypothetical protein